MTNQNLDQNLDQNISDISETLFNCECLYARILMLSYFITTRNIAVLINMPNYNIELCVNTVFVDVEELIKSIEALHNTINIEWLMNNDEKLWDIYKNQIETLISAKSLIINSTRDSVFKDLMESINTVRSQIEMVCDNDNILKNVKTKVH